MKLSELVEKKKSKKGLKYHKSKKLPLYKNIYRPYSTAFYGLFHDAREEYKNGEYTPRDDFEVELLDSSIGEFGVFGESLVPLDIPLVENRVELDSPKRGGNKKFYVYTKNPETGRVIKVEFGDTSGLNAKINNKEARENFSKRHKCDEKNDKTTAGYWSCRLPYYAEELGLKGGGDFFW